MASYISIGVAGYEIFILSPFTPFFREAGSLVGNQVVTTELYSLIVLHPEERQRPFRLGNVIIDGTSVYAKERAASLTEYDCSGLISENCLHISISTLF
jgi:hypothetical protein